jgi:hypothetical protein
MMSSTYLTKEKRSPSAAELAPTLVSGTANAPITGVKARTARVAGAKLTMASAVVVE